MGAVPHGYVGSTRSAGHPMAQPGDSDNYAAFGLETPTRDGNGSLWSHPCP